MNLNIRERCQKIFQSVSGKTQQSIRAIASITGIPKSSVDRHLRTFKRGQLPALPIYLANEDCIIGLMFLLTIALRCFTLMEFQVRRQLQTQQNEIADLYAGNLKRKTQRPNAEQLLAAFAGITLHHHRDGTSEITPLNNLQRRILALMKVPETIYVLPVQT